MSAFQHHKQDLFQISDACHTIHWIPTASKFVNSEEVSCYETAQWRRTQVQGLSLALSRLTVPWLKKYKLYVTKKKKKTWDHNFHFYYRCVCGPGSVVGIATGYGLGGPGIESRWGARFFVTVQTGLGAHPASCTMGTGSLLWVKSSQGVTLTPHPLLEPWSRKGRAIPLLPPMGRTACTEPQCLYKGALYSYFIDVFI